MIKPWLFLYVFSSTSSVTNRRPIKDGFVCLFVSMGFRGKPRMYFRLSGFLYRPLWTFQFWSPDARAPTDASRTPAAEDGTYGT
jgi:hypothetical protein